LRILVTGGAGFIGSNLVEDLLAEGMDVIVLDSMDTGSMQNLSGLEGRLDVIESSCSEIPSLDLKPDAIFHLGIPSSSPMYKRDPSLVGSAINESIAVFELARSSGARVVYASSSSLYNGLKPPHNEEMPIQVADYYAEARLSIERMAKLYHSLYGLSSAGMRFFSVYGPRERAKKQYANMVSQFLWQLLEGKQPTIYGDGSQTRDFVYVKDVISALRLAMDSDLQGVVNVGTGNAYSFNDLLDMLQERLGISVAPKYVENPIKNYVMHTQADTSRAESLLKFKARYSLKEGIDLLAEHCCRPGNL
jgi:UDP-glucose 4-epimerase